MAELGEATIVVNVEMQDLRKQLKEVETQFKKVAKDISDNIKKTIGGAFRSVVKIAKAAAIGVTAAFAGVAATVAGIFTTVLEAGREADLVDFYKTVFRGVLDEAQVFNRQLQDIYNVSATAATDVLTRTQDLLKGGIGFSETDALQLTKIVSQLSADLAQTSGKSFEETAASIRQILSGSFEVATSNFGVKISEDLIRTEALRLGLIDEQTKKIDQQTKAVAALNILANGTADAQGKAAINSRGFTAQLTRLFNILERIRLSVGRAFLDSFTNALILINDQLDNLDTVVSSVLQVIKPTIDLLSNATIALFDNPERIPAIIEQAGKAAFEVIARLGAALGESIANGIKAGLLSALVVSKQVGDTVESRFTKFGSILGTFGLTPGDVNRGLSASNVIDPFGGQAFSDLFTQLEELSGIGQELVKTITATPEDLINSINATAQFITGSQFALDKKNENLINGLQSTLDFANKILNIGSAVLNQPIAQAAITGKITSPEQLSRDIQQAALQQQSPELKEAQKQTGILDGIKKKLDDFGTGFNIVFGL